ncbi:MFS transporter [Bacillus sp. 1P06AnD]|uniref:MFS transporter n=1 Tax=Bacillus sp. 1P06AnD TaxID=3132208 RepID=UPI00399F2C2C
MKGWKNPILLLTGIGISYLGNWIYLIALNISVLHSTGSAAAVAGLYIIRPVAVLITNIWAGSIIDRINKKRLMIIVDCMRGVLVFLLPFLDSITALYLLLLLINMIGSFFGPSSTIYITKLIPAEKRKRFNSILGMANSGAFLLGPAIAGFLIMYVGTEVCIFMNAISFMLCALFIGFLPNIEDAEKHVKALSHWKTVVQDWRTVKEFVIKAKFFMFIYVLFQGAWLIGFAIDSQEVTFIKQHLQLTDRDYGLIVSISGVGTLAGAFCSAIVANKIQLKMYIGIGMLLTSLGYMLFYSSYNFLTATASFIFLGFFMAFASTGYSTFFQNNIPVGIMGRFGSLSEMVQGMIQIILTLILGFLAEWFSLQFVCLAFAAVGTLIALALLAIALIPSKGRYFTEQTEIIDP